MHEKELTLHMQLAIMLSKLGIPCLPVNDVGGYVPHLDAVFVKTAANN